ncbi:ABC transporter substrate-binding protein [Lentisphaera profundi]|uniref:ABC transporter substrate-binding protein n=1 Tax=Lentisphaera profundi TaxID=1658616 RepID=A0ABY7VWN0_9BACT|nr:ABC transporter substrate-binding protein [Lentisphaera profundi]WDE98645.1 ABC transporter substrate-binding protein [Lentisphaera profundi]
MNKLMLLFSLLFLYSCKDETPKESELTKVKIKLNWFPEAEHGGYFHGLSSGIYEKAGLDVEIVDGGPGNPVETEVAIGRFEFGIANADKILAVRENGLKVVGLLAPYQTSPRCLIAHENESLESFADIAKANRLIINDTKPFYKYLVHKHPEIKKVQTVAYSQALFLGDLQSIMQGYINSEPLIIRDKSFQIKTLSLADLGYNPYASVLICSEQVIQEKPDLVKAMVQATQKAWLEYLQDPSSANKIILERNPELGATLKRSSALLPGMMNADPFGQMTPERWNTLAKQLHESGVLKSIPTDLKQAYNSSFLK